MLARRHPGIAGELGQGFLKCRMAAFAVAARSSPTATRARAPGNQTQRINAMTKTERLAAEAYLKGLTTAEFEAFYRQLAGRNDLVFLDRDDFERLAATRRG